MPFQFGTNWSRYSHMTADIVAPLMAYEGLTAFFLEAGFLGVLLFGRKLVPQWAHFVAAIMVALGTLMSTFWILVAEQLDADARPASRCRTAASIPDDWIAVIFNPSFPYRFAHTVVAVYLTTAFTVIGVAAYHLRHRQFVDESKVMIAMGVALATVLVPLQALIGDAHGLNTLEHQPAEARRDRGDLDDAARAAGGALRTAGREERGERLRDRDSEAREPLPHARLGRRGQRAQGRSPRNDRPPVAPVFFGFRAMVGMWVHHAAHHRRGLGLACAEARSTRRGWFLRACTWAIPVGYVAVTAGWITTEVGRQPWVVYNQLRTADAVTPNLDRARRRALACAVRGGLLRRVRRGRRTTS